MENNKYKIEKLQDILDCTNVDNIDNFLLDLKGLLLQYYVLKEINEDLAKFKDFTWVDDGKHDINIELKIIDK